jgi:hypothetical protein
MRVLIIICISVLIPAYPAMCQDKGIYIGARIGGAQYSWENTGTLTTLQSGSSGSWSFNGHARQELSNNWYLGLEAGFNRSTAELILYTPRLVYGEGTGHQMAILSLGPSLRKEFPLPGKLGFQVSISTPLTYTIFPSYPYAGDTFRGIVRQGDKKPVTDIYVYGNVYTNRKFNVHIRPELGLFYSLGERGRLTLDALWGISPGGPLAIRDFHEIIYEGNSYQAKNTLNSNFTAVLIGYEYRLLK